MADPRSPSEPHPNQGTARRDLPAPSSLAQRAQINFSKPKRKEKATVTLFALRSLVVAGLTDRHTVLVRRPSLLIFLHARLGSRSVSHRDSIMRGGASAAQHSTPLNLHVATNPTRPPDGILPRTGMMIARRMYVDNIPPRVPESQSPRLHRQPGTPSRRDGAALGNGQLRQSPARRTGKSNSALCWSTLRAGKSVRHPTSTAHFPQSRLVSSPLRTTGPGSSKHTSQFSISRIPIPPCQPDS